MQDRMKHSSISSRCLRKYNCVRLFASHRIRYNEDVADSVSRTKLVQCNTGRCPTTIILTTSVYEM